MPSIFQVTEFVDSAIDSLHIEYNSVVYYASIAGLIFLLVTIFALAGAFDEVSQSGKGSL